MRGRGTNVSARILVLHAASFTNYVAIRQKPSLWPSIAPQAYGEPILGRLLTICNVALVAKYNGPCPLWVKSRHLRRKRHVCFSLEGGHVRCTSACPLWANSGPCVGNQAPVRN